MKKFVLICIACLFFATTTEANYRGDLLKAGIDVTGNGIHFNYNGLSFEGTTKDAYETTLSFTDPTADRTFTFPDSSGTILTNNNFGSSVINGSSLILEGATEDAFETTITVTDPTADTTVTIADGATGSVMVSSLATNAPDVANSVTGASNAILYEGTADAFETSLTATDATADRTITLPDATGTVLLNSGSTATDLTVSGRLVTADGVGAVAGSGVTLVETGSGAFHQTVITFTDVDVALTDEAGVVAYGGLKIYDFPEGYIYVLGTSADIALTKSSAGVNDDWDGDFGVGTVTATNDATLATTEQNIIPTTATPQAAAGATTSDGVSTATEHAILDGHTTPIDMFINYLVDDADHDVTTTPCNLIVNGTLTILWTSIGDN